MKNLCMKTIWRQICSLLFSIIIWSLFHQAVSLRLRSLVFSLSHLTACTGWAPRQNTAPPTCQNTKLLSKPTRFHTGAGRSLLCSGQNRSFFSLQRELWKHPAPNKQIRRRKTTEAENKREIWKGNRNKSEMSWESNSSSSRASDSCHVTLLTHIHTLCIYTHLRRPSLTPCYYKCPHSPSTVIGPDKGRKNMHTLPVHWVM